MRTLVYKRTHTGDPGKDGCFGAADCMGSIRAREFSAVIGVGGVGPEPRRYGIDGKVNWVGVGPRRLSQPVGWRGPLVVFDRFVLLDADGPDLEELAPALARRIYSNSGRAFMSFTEEEQAELERILLLAQSEPASSSARPVKRCKPRRIRCGSLSACG